MNIYARGVPRDNEIRTPRAHPAARNRIRGNRRAGRGNRVVFPRKRIRLPRRDLLRKVRRERRGRRRRRRAAVAKETVKYERV